MRLYSGKYGIIATDIIDALLKAELIELSPEARPEAELDVVGVLREYNRMDRQLGERARDLAGDDGRSNHFQMKRRLAKEKGFKLGDDAIEYIVAQIIEIFLQSQHIDEIYGEDRELRARITPIIKKHTADQEEALDREVRSKLKNLEDGSAAFDIEYERVIQRIRDKKGLDS